MHKFETGRAAVGLYECLIDALGESNVIPAKTVPGVDYIVVKTWLGEFMLRIRAPAVSQVQIIQNPRTPDRMFDLADPESLDQILRVIDFFKPGLYPDEHNQRIFYRALAIPESLNGWKDRVYKSYHRSPPPAWYEVWKSSGSSINPLLYPLDCGRQGYYSQEARAAFLKFMAGGQTSLSSDAADGKQACELGGLCSYPDPREAFAYGQTSSLAEKGADRYVEFWGVKLGPTPEEDGVVAWLVRPRGSPFTANEFRARYRRQIEGDV
ncbi:MAG: hypothetical protein ABSH35_30155 [Isosphaeraceae bacterium]|jgi:hypothetical protein